MKKSLSTATATAVQHTARGLLLAASLIVGLPASSAWAAPQDSSDFALAAKEHGAREPRGLRFAAEAGLKTLLADLGRDIAPGTLPDGFPFDVKDFSELKNATLGLAFEVHTVNPQQFVGNNAALGSQIKGNGIWNYVVLVEGHPVALLEMAQVNGRWEVQGAGGAELAQNVYQAAQNHSGKKAFRFVRIYQATSDLLEVQDATSNSRYVPLIAAQKTLGMAHLAKGATALASADVMPALQDAVRKHLAAHAASDKPSKGTK